MLHVETCTYVGGPFPLAWYQSSLEAALIVAGLSHGPRLVACKSGLAEAKFSIWPDIPSPVPHNKNFFKNKRKTRFYVKSTWSAQKQCGWWWWRAGRCPPAITPCPWEPLLARVTAPAPWVLWSHHITVRPRPGQRHPKSEPRPWPWTDFPVGCQTCLATADLPGCCPPQGAAGPNGSLAAEHPKSSATKCLRGYLLNSGFLLVLRCYRRGKFKYRLKNVDILHIKKPKMSHMSIFLQ